MTKKLFFFGAVIAVVTLATLVVRQVVGPKSLPIIDLSPIQRPEQAGILAFRGLKEVLDSAQFIAIGVDSAVSGGDEILAGLFKAIASAQIPFAQWRGQAPYVDIRKALSQGHKGAVIFPLDALMGSFRQQFEISSHENLGQEPLILLISPIDVSAEACRGKQIIYNVYDDQFVPCSSLALLSRRFRRIYSKSEHFMALSHFGKRTYVLFVQ